MLSSLSSNAVLAKSRAMYGTRLKSKQYQALLQCRTINEAGTYLKTQTVYADVLKNYSPTSANRHYLEHALGQKLFQRYASLCKYEMTVGRQFYSYFIVKGDIDYINHTLRVLYAKHPEDYQFKLPDFFISHSKLKIQQLRNATTFEDILHILQGTEYRGLLDPFVPFPGETIDFTGLEAALYQYLFDFLHAIAEEHFSGNRQKELLSLLGLNIDMKNIVSIYRLKKFDAISPDQIRTLLLPHGLRIKGKTLDKLLSFASAEDVLQWMGNSEYKKFFLKYQSYSMDEIAQQALYNASLHHFRFSSNPSVVLMSYVLLFENEISNITHIIEGIRYSVPPEEIEKLLIGTDE